MVSILLLALPLLTALTAWGTAYLLIHSVLYPLTPFRVAGIAIQGFLPSYLHADNDEITHRLAQEIVNKLQASDLQVDTATVKPIIEAHLDTYLRVRLREKMPVIASFIGDSTLAKLKESMIEEIDALLPQVIASFLASSATPANVQAKVSAIIKGITPAKLEAIAVPILLQVRSRVSVLFALFGLIVGSIASGILYCISQCL